jgi:crossover junction endodeoxyribonuclease RusA
MSRLPSLDDYERSDVEEARWRGPEFSRPPRGVVPRGGSYDTSRALVLTFTVRGIPQSQGSLNGYVRGGRAIVTDRNKALKPWRHAVTEACCAAMTQADWVEPYDGPVAVAVLFSLPKPRSAPKRCRTFPKALDVDKGARGCLDAMVQAGCIYDDNRVVDLHVWKLYVGDIAGLPFPGAQVWLNRL